MKEYIDLKVFPTQRDLSFAAADIFINIQKSRNYKTFIIPGGKTPWNFFQNLAQRVNDWSHTTLMLSDERLVKVENPESNTYLVNRNLMDLIQGIIHPYLIPIVNGFSTEQPSHILKSLNALTRPMLPPLAAFLGIGVDGHTASLFPDFEKDFYKDDPFILVDKPSEPFQRISVSAKVLSGIPLLVFLVTGKEKKSIIQQIINGSNHNSPLPVQRIIKSNKGEIIILCDQDAAPE